MVPYRMNRIIGGNRYDTRHSTLIAHDAWWDGRSCERNFSNTFLWRTRKGNYFLTHQTWWQGARDWLRPISKKEAVELYQGYLLSHEVKFEEAFPELAVEDA